jgi:tetratricopeptide (TPR) repeat protein
MLPLLGTACVGITILLVFAIFTRPDAPPGEQTEQPVPTTPPTVESLKQETYDVVRTLMDDFPNQSDPMGLMGSVAHQFGDTDGAVSWWQRVLDRNPNRVDAYIGMGRVHFEEGAFEKAVEMYRKALAVRQTPPTGHYHLGEALLELGRPEEAVSALKAETRHHPGGGGAYLLLGQAFLQLQAYDQAIPQYRVALEKLPGDSRPCYGLAKAHAKLGQRDKAAEYSKTFKRLRAEENKRVQQRRKRHTELTYLARIAARTHTKAGLVYLGHGHAGKAEQHWRRAAFLDSENELCRQKLTDLYMSRNDWAKALDVCKQLPRIDARNATHHLNTGVLFGRLKQYAAAEKEIRHALRLDPKHIPAHRALIHILLSGNHKLHEAKALAEKLVALEPTAPHYALLSEVCFQNGDQAGAKRAMQRAAQLDPNYADVSRRSRPLR